MKRIRMKMFSIFLILKHGKFIIMFQKLWLKLKLSEQSRLKELELEWKCFQFSLYFNMENLL